MRQNPDMFGFYQVGNCQTYSKLEAIELHTKTGIHPHWNFNEQVYNQFDWTVEPKQSLSELYRQRAEQIRINYDYVILAYSGGADSNNILDTFVDNNIKIDELFSFHNYEYTGDADNLANAEIFKVVTPKFEQLKVKWPDLQFRTIDFTQDVIERFENSDMIESWGYETNIHRTPWHSFKYGLKERIPEWRDIIDSGRRLVIIYGLDKPRVTLKEGRYAFRFIESVDMAISAREQKENKDGNNYELFYWSPEAPLIPIKQAHVIKNYLQHANERTEFMTKTKSDLAYKYLSDGSQLWLSASGVHTLIYPKWNPTVYVESKTPSIFFAQRDNWFFSANNNEKAAKNFYNSMANIWNKIPDYWRNNPNNIYFGQKLSFSKEYFLE